MDVQYGLVGFILIIGIMCALFDIPEKFQKLLYILAAVLVMIVVLSFFGVTFGGHVQVLK